MKKIIILAAAGLLLAGCLPINKPDETKTIGEPETTKVQQEESLDELEKEVNDTQVEDFDGEIKNLDQDINQL